MQRCLSGDILWDVMSFELHPTGLKPPWWIYCTSHCLVSAMCSTQMPTATSSIFRNPPNVCEGTPAPISFTRSYSIRHLRYFLETEPYPLACPLFKCSMPCRHTIVVFLVSQTAHEHLAAHVALIALITVSLAGTILAHSDQYSEPSRIHIPWKSHSHCLPRQISRICPSAILPGSSTRATK